MDLIPNVNDEIKLFFENDRFRREIRRRADTIDPKTASDLGRAYAMNPNINPELLASIVLGGGNQNVLGQVSEIAARQQLRDGYGVSSQVGRPYVLPNGPVGNSASSALALLRENNINKVAEHVDLQGEEGGDRGLFGWLHTGLKGAVRGAMVVSESGWQATEAFIKGLTDEMGNLASGQGPSTDVSLSDVYRNTSLYEAFRQQFQEGGADLGSGYFVSGSVRERQAARQREALGTVTMPGGEVKTWNAGLGFARALSSTYILPYNDAAWTTASGIYSALGAVAFDPLNALGLGIAQRGATSVDNLARLNSRTGRKVNEAIAAARAAEQSGDMVTALRYNEEALRMLGIEDYAPGNFQSAKDRLTGLGDARRQVEAFLRDEAGFVSAGGERTLLIPEFARKLTKDDSIRAMQSIAEEKDIAKIYRLHKGKIGAKVINELAEANTIDEVIRTYAYALGNPGEASLWHLGYLPEMGLLNLPEKGLIVRNKIAPYTRWFNYMPNSSILDPRDGMQYVSTVDNLYATLPTAATFRKTSGGKLKYAVSEDRARRWERYDVERRDEMIRRSVKAFASGDETAIKNLNSEIAEDFRRMFLRMGWSEEEASSLTRWAAERDRIGQFSATDLQNPVDVIEAPLMVSQLLQSGAAVIDPTKLKQVFRGSGRVRQMRRLNTKYHALTDESADLVGKIQELEGAMKLPNATPDQLKRWGDELNDLNKKQRDVQRRVEELAVNGSPEERGFIQGAILRGDHFMSQWWKPITLVRAAYILRIVPEEIARVVTGGVFGTGPGAFMDFILASMGDVNVFGKAGRYEVDALGMKFAGKARESQELAFRKTDLQDELNTATLRNDPVEIKRLQDEIKRIDDELDLIDPQLWEAFEETMISLRQGDALTTITRDVTGASVTDRRQLAMMSGGHSLAQKSFSGQRDNWVEGLTNLMVQAATDPHFNKLARVASGGSLPKTDRFAIRGVVGNWDEHVAAGRIRDVREGLVFWMQGGTGRPHLDRLIRSYADKGRILDPDSFEDVAWLVDRQASHLATITGGKPANAAFSPSALNGDVVPGQLYNIIDDAQQDLLQAIADKRFAGNNLIEVNSKVGGIEVNKAFRERLRAFGDDPSAPERMLYNNQTINGEKRFAFLRDRIVGPFFTKLYGIPSDKLARSPAFRRFYWLQMEQLMRSADDAAAFRLVENAQKANLPTNLLNRIVDASKARVVTPGGGVSLKALDEVAKSAALSRVQELLYDASRRGAGLDQMRLITPFGDAWKEVWQMWGKEIVRQRGMPVKRLAKGVEGMRDANVMQQDPVTGEWHVQVPFSDKLARLAFLGKPDLQDFPTAPFTMPAQSLNVLGTFSPGVGPVVNMGVNSLLPDDPSWDKVRDWFFPVAEPALPETEAGRNNLWQQLVFPSPWIRRAAAALPEDNILGVLRNFVNDLESDPVFQATRNHVVQSLASARPVSETRGADNQKKLFDDANEIAKRMYFMRGVFAFIGPGAPMPKYIAETGQGNMPAAILTDEWRRLEQELLAAGENPGLASQMMIDVYGPEIWLYTASNSNSTIKGAQASNAWWDWYRTEGKQVVDKYPLTGAYFGDTGDFSIDAYGSLFSRGIYERKKGEALYEEAATDVAFLAYNRLRDMFPPESQRSPEQRRMLASARMGLEQYWGVSLSGSVRIAEREKQINELRRLLDANDRGDSVATAVLSTDVGQMLMQYMATRDVFAQQAVEMLGGGTETSFRQMRAAAPLRDALRQLGGQLSAENETFARIYQFVLEGELFDDEDMSDMEATPRPERGGRVRPGEPGRRSIIPRIPTGTGR
jgi:hypothetical protein